MRSWNQDRHRHRHEQDGSTAAVLKSARFAQFFFIPFVTL
jgi:hypothetical protein